MEHFRRFEIVTCSYRGIRPMTGPDRTGQLRLESIGLDRVLRQTLEQQEVLC